MAASATIATTTAGGILRIGTSIPTTPSTRAPSCQVTARDRYRRPPAPGRYPWRPPRGCSSTAEPQPSKLVVRVRFPSPAPERALLRAVAISPKHGHGRCRATIVPLLEVVGLREGVSSSQTGPRCRLSLLRLGPAGRCGWSASSARTLDRVALIIVVASGPLPARRLPLARRAVAAGRHAGLDLTAATPTLFDEVRRRPALTITVCDRAHEEFDPDPEGVHWSIPEPVPHAIRAAFDATVLELRRRPGRCVITELDRAPETGRRAPRRPRAPPSWHKRSASPWGSSPRSVPGSWPAGYRHTTASRSCSRAPLPLPPP